MLGDDVSEDVVKEMFAEMDVNHDGKIEYSEFIKYWRAIMIKTNVTPLQKFKTSARKVLSILKAMHLHSPMTSKVDPPKKIDSVFQNVVANASAAMDAAAESSK